MKKYTIIKLNNQTKFNYLVISLTYESVLSYINELLKEINKDVVLLFDTFLTNAEKSNRYIEVNIENGKIDKNNFKIVNNSLITPNIINLSYKYFNTNPAAINNGVLTSSEKEKFINKCKNSL